MLDISTEQSDLMASMWKELNSSFLTWFHAKSPADLLGPCNVNCSAAHWTTIDRSSGGVGPICGVPGCAPL